MSLVNLIEKFNLFSDYWSPRIVGQLNGQLVKLVKFKGEFMWHTHENEDELFMVIQGEINIELRDHHVTVKEGEFYIIPRGIEHKPSAAEEAYVLLLEPASTEQTGGIEHDLRVNKQYWI